MRKVLCLMLAIVLLLTTFAIAWANNVFEDIANIFLVDEFYIYDELDLLDDSDFSNEIEGVDSWTFSIYPMPETRETFEFEAFFAFSDFGIEPMNATSLSFYELQTAQVATGEQHTVVLKSDGSVWTFGANARGQLGNGLRQPLVTIPHRVQGIIMILAGVSDLLNTKYSNGDWYE